MTPHKTTEGLEERIANIKTKAFTMMGQYARFSDYMDEAIESLLLRQHEQDMAMVREMVDGMKVLLHIDENRGDNIGVEENFGTGHNAALDDILSKLVSPKATL